MIWRTILTSLLALALAIAPAHPNLQGTYQNLSVAATGIYTVLDETPLNATLSVDRLTATHTTTTQGGARSHVAKPLNFSATANYIEFTINNITGADSGVGILSVDNPYSDLTTFDASAGSMVKKNGDVLGDIFSTINIGALVNGDIIRFAWNATTCLAWYARNGGDWNNNPTADPASGSGGLPTNVCTNHSSATLAMNFAGTGTSATENFTINSGATPFTYAIPSGFVSGLPQSIGFDTSSSFGFDGASGSGMSLTSATTGNVILIFVHSVTSGVSPTVSSITGASLTFVAYGTPLSIINTNNAFQQNIEAFWAYTPTPLTAQSFTVTLTGAAANTAVIAQFITGVNNPSDPFDPSSSWLTNTNVTGTANAVTVPGLNTAKDNGIVLSFYGGTTSNPITGTGYRVLRERNRGDALTDLMGKVTYAPIVSETVTWGVNQSDWGASAFSLTGSP